MRIQPGTRVGPYEILAPLGAGGMGEVYRARDTRLGREVAVKVLPQHLSSNAAARARFEREAKAVSSLNHPHICTLHDVGREGDTDYLVMEMIEGETLAQRLTRGPLPLPDVLRLGAQIAGALDGAHRSGVVHRDLKPGNVMLTKTGAKLMDFGLAKERGGASSPTNLTVSPTMTAPLTAEGTVVGTFQYMAPEQLEGKEADARGDLFALGVVIYEMATGRRAFDGKTQASLIAAILKDDPPPIRTAGAVSPPTLDRLVRQCLRKDPDERIQSAHDVRLQLEAIAETASSPEAAAVAGAPSHGRWRERLAWGIAALAVLIAAGLAASLRLKPAQAPRLLVSSIVAPEGTSFDPTSPGVALSPDGRRIAYVTRGPGVAGLWVRALDSTGATLLVAGGDIECPCWSPDSRALAFHSGAFLKKIDVEGGQSVTLGPMRDCLGTSWGHDGNILYVPDRISPIMSVPAAGGEPRVVSAQRSSDSRRNYSQPSLLPDGRHILFTVNESWQGGTNSGIYVASIGGENEKLLLPVLSNARYVEPGYLIYAKDGSLRAHRFDPGRLELSGEPMHLVEGVQYVGSYQSHLFSLSGTGLLAYAEGKGTLTRQLTWVDRKGAILGTAGKPGNYFTPRLSHDGGRAAYDLSEDATDSGDIWVLDLDSGISSRLTFDPRNESAPIWSRDDKRLLFFGDQPGRTDLFTIPSDGTGAMETILSNGATNFATDWSTDGDFILVQGRTAAGMGMIDLMIWSYRTQKLETWLATPFLERQGRFSPDSRWIAYDSNESGRVEVYVRGFSPPGGKWRVSSEGGSSPVWSRDGRELFYLSPDSKIMSVAVGQGGEFQGGRPVPLFSIPGDLLSVDIFTQFDVAPDGQRFLMNLNTPTQGQRMITLVSDWTALLKGKEAR